MKICKICQIEQNVENFYISRSLNKEYRKSYCKNCSTKKLAQWRHKNPIKSRNHVKKWQKENPEKYRNSQLKRKYGISIEEYNELLKNQNNVCAICEIHKPLELFLCVDHNHKTSKIRGLLCSNCNVAIGLLKDNPIFFDKASIYLKKSIDKIE